MQIVFLFVLLSCSQEKTQPLVKPAIKVSENSRYLEYQDGNCFLWIGGTTWGMSEWMTREDINLYLDNRKEKGFNIVQVCLFWGKRQEDPVDFFINPVNSYGHKAFAETGGKPNALSPLVVDGGSPENPNDYWDHVDYILKAAKERNMIVGLLPVWGRRYVNGTHSPFSQQAFKIHEMKSYGKFLGERLKSFDNIIWVMGG